MPVLKETYAGSVSPPLNDWKSLMPKLVAKQSAPARGSSEVEPLGGRDGKDSDKVMKRLTAKVLIIGKRATMTTETLDCGFCLQDVILTQARSPWMRTWVVGVI